MVILDGDAEGLARAVALVSAAPNQRHLDEDRIMTGRRRDISEMLADSLEVTALAAYAILGDEAFVSGVSLDPVDGGLRHQAWMLATAGSVGHPRWLFRSGRDRLRAFDFALKWPRGYVQAIPASYPEGGNYVRHLGFREVRRVPMGGDEAIVFERMVPRWAQ